MIGATTLTAAVGQVPGATFPLVVGIAAALVAYGRTYLAAVTLVGNWVKSGLRMVAIGLGAAGLGFLIGTLFHTSAA